VDNDTNAPSETAPSSPQAEGSGTQTLADRVRLALRKVKDPELNLNIVDLGLVYDIVVDDAGNVEIDMSLTSPGCPAGPQIMGDVEKAVKAVPGVTHVGLNLVWNPMWSPDRIEPRVRAYMGL
jgi:Predicted metal-sulfur cluster biosynthetic enzyme